MLNSKLMGRDKAGRVWGGRAAAFNCVVLQKVKGKSCRGDDLAREPFRGGKHQQKVSGMEIKGIEEVFGRIHTSGLSLPGAACG